MKLANMNIPNKIRQTVPVILIFASLVMNSVFTVYSTDYETVSQGNWTSTSTWKNGQVPGTTVNAGHTITIKHYVTMNANVNLNCDMNIVSGASLITTSYKLTLNAASLTNQGTFYVKYLDNNSGKIANYNSFTVANTTSNNSGSIMSKGDISLGKFLNNNGDFSASGSISFSDYSQNNGNGKIELADKVSIGTSFLLNDKSCLSINGKASIGTGVQLNSGTLVLKGDVNFSGTLTINGAELTNYANTNMTGIFTFNSGKLTNYGTIIINNKAYMYNNSATVTYGNIYFKSTLTNYSKSVSVETTDTSTGNFITLSTVSGNKDITVNRHITHSGWHYVSSPVSNAQSNVFNGAALYSYDETKGAWVAHKSGENLVVGKGYDVYYKNKNQVVTFTGTMNTGSVVMNLTKTLSGGQGYNLVGNPYPAAIDWDAATGWTKTNISNAIYVWDMKNNNIAAYNNKVGTNGGSNMIPATSAFFVICNNTLGGSLKMTDAVKVNSKPNFRESKPENIVRVKLSNGLRYDETVIRFDETATSKFDHEFDAEKMYSFDASTPQIYSFSKENIDLAISAMNMTSEPVHVQLGYIANAEGKYSLDFNFESFDPTVNVYLEDTELNIMHDLHTGNYVFNTVTGENNSRFILHFIPVQIVNNNSGNDTLNSNVSAIENKADNGNMKIYSVNKKIYVQTVSENTSVSVFNVSGQEIISENLKGIGLHSIDMQAYNGCFIVRTISGELAYSAKVIVD
ncbi:MAG TPA: hypothetical protein P5050_12410 [Bacteroidia bacterium]|nr:hypothetical protein [Bacteroidia bacterium]HRS60008.1 hypothetical protein [Bacteroidia bacterium]